MFFGLAGFHSRMRTNFEPSKIATRLLKGSVGCFMEESKRVLLRSLWLKNEVTNFDFFRKIVTTANLKQRTRRSIFLSQYSSELLLFLSSTLKAQFKPINTKKQELGNQVASSIPALSIVFQTIRLPIKESISFVFQSKITWQKESSGLRARWRKSNLNLSRKLTMRCRQFWILWKNYGFLGKIRVSDFWCLK